LAPPIIARVGDNVAAGCLAVTLTGPFCSINPTLHGMRHHTRRAMVRHGGKLGQYGAICRSEGRNRSLIATGCDFWADGPVRCGQGRWMMRRIGIVLFTLGLLVSAGPVRAEDFPSRRVTLVVAFSAGGPVDVVARVFADRLGQRWGVPVTVENRTGAGGNLAAALVAKAAPDGYTILFTATGVAINQSLMANPGFGIAELAPIAFPSVSSITLAVNPETPATTLEAFVAAHRTHNFTFGTAGIGSGAHLTAEYLFKALAKIEAIHTPFQGAPQASNALLGNHIDLISVATSDATPLIQQGRLRGLGVSGEARSPVMPDVPTLREQGFDLVTHGWVTVMVPARTPAAVAEALNAAFNDVIEDPDVRHRLVNSELNPRRQSLADAAQFLQTELATWSRMVGAIGLKLK
jgi:tripartite-type tricarboxylate transporter receptor subunit TctC